MLGKRRSMERSIILPAEDRNDAPLLIVHVNSIPTMQFFTGVSRNTQSKSNMLSWTECVWEF